MDNKSAHVTPPVSTPSPQGNPVTVTVKLDDGRYRRLKTFGLNHRRTNQDVLVAALDEYLQAHGG